MMNKGSINGIDASSTKRLRIKTSRGTRREKRNNSRTDGYENSDKKIFQGLIFHI